jgi:DNA-binding NarL/FixJ family response regulator
MAKKIVILEDNEDRAAAMRRCLQERFCEFEVSFFNESATMIDYLRSHLPDTILICLDHDLELMPGVDGRLIDPGTGRDVADYLAGQAPVCPVVIHTTNSAAGTGMEMVLQEARWQTQRVSAYNDLEWIPTKWARTIRRAVVGRKKDVQQ